jgi:tRNA (guanine-N7-)-methyltransferase
MNKIRTKFDKYIYLTKSKLHALIKQLTKRIIRFKHLKYIDLYRFDKLDAFPYPTDFSDYFKYSNLIVEIGSGHGELPQHLAKNKPKDLILSFEVSKKYARKTHYKLKKYDNAYSFRGDGYQAVENILPQDSIDKIYIMFPDPWHKTKHHKRRPLVTDWLEVAYEKLKKGGSILFVTDWEEYYKFVEEEIRKVGKCCQYRIKKGKYVETEFGLIKTHYHKKWTETTDREFRYIELIKL